MNPYLIHLWQSQNWRKADRHYSCRLCQNLFGTWIVMRIWGTVKSNRGRSMETTHASYEDALRFFEATEQRRTTRGYHLQQSVTNR